VSGEVFVNDAPHLLPESGGLAALLAALGYDRPRVAAVINEVVIPRSRWAQAALKAGDRIAVFELVAGG
jgi:sulfur carrier protein